MQTGQTLVFGSSGTPWAGAVGQPQNIFEAVRSWAWTSIPMTVSYRVAASTAMRAIVCCAAMKIGEWENLGRARALLQKQIGQLGATELASHVTVNPDNGRMRIFVATDAALIEYSYTPTSPEPNAPWILRGQAIRWGSVRGIRLVTDGQVDDSSGETQSIWRFVSEEPKIELSANSQDGDVALEALLALARACLQHGG